MKDDDSSTRIKTMAQQANASVAAHEARIDRIEDDIREMKNDIKSMCAILSEARGSWRTLVMIGGACGTLGAVASWVVSNITIKH